MTTSKRFRRGVVIAAAVLVSIGSTVTTAQAKQVEPHPIPYSASVDAPAHEPGAVSNSRRISANCPAPREGKPVACLRVVKPHMLPKTSQPNLRALTDTLQPVPQWCVDNAYQGVYATRTEACEISGLSYTTSSVVNGVTTVTGELDMNVFNYAYTSTSLSNWAHQIQVSGYAGWGDALAASVEGATSTSGACTTSYSSFSSQPLAPLNTYPGGDAFFDTTATTPGAIGSCNTSWNLVFTNANPIYPAADTSVPMTEIRCDNATAGNASIGCVVPWYPSSLIYSQNSYPALAAHVSQAQASGLPGGSFAAPLYRTTDEATAQQNRQLACGDAPSIAGLSCDEYPIARSYEGLTAGGARRTFNNCGLNLPQTTGPTGVSVCMITATENNAQGGINTQFFRSQRVLDLDPFLIVVGA